MKLRRFLKPLMPTAVINRYELELLKETHINRALRRVGRNTTYVEIGVRDGECIRQIRADKRIAIDPAPLALDSPNWNGVQVHQVTSDNYFQFVAPDDLNQQKIDVALADGLHEFRQTLRDVLNLERWMSPAGIVFIHDCNPPTRAHAENKNGPWNGDVWKVAFYLQSHRPDLRYTTLDCDWGLGVVSGFSRRPPEPNDSDIEAVDALDYQVLDGNRKKILNLTSPLLSFITIG